MTSRVKKYFAIFVVAVIVIACICIGVLLIKGVKMEDVTIKPNSAQNVSEEQSAASQTGREGTYKHEGESHRVDLSGQHINGDVIISWHNNETAKNSPQENETIPP
uniref:Uncharacterized protein n=1 Tax=Bombyx mori TaxID=7091 RepID=A0A8R2C7L2_BOMMO|nr:uncharacterized protein LOC105842094 [Bombyx mori]